MFHHPATGKQRPAVRLFPCLQHAARCRSWPCCRGNGQCLHCLHSRPFIYTRWEFRFRHLQLLEIWDFSPRCFSELLWLPDSFHFSNFGVFSLLASSDPAFSFFPFLIPLTCFCTIYLFLWPKCVLVWDWEEFVLVNLYQERVALCWQLTLALPFLAILAHKPVLRRRPGRHEPSVSAQTAFRSLQFKFQPFLIKSSSKIIKPAGFRRISC